MVIEYPDGIVLSTGQNPGNDSFVIRVADDCGRNCKVEFDEKTAKILAEELRSYLGRKDVSAQTVLVRDIYREKGGEV